MYEQLAPVDVGANAQEGDVLTSAERVLRYQYSKVGLSCRKFVIVDVFEDGCEDFSESEAGEVCWYPYNPSAEERAAFHKFTHSQQGTNRWPLLRF